MTHKPAGWSAAEWRARMQRKAQRRSLAEWVVRWIAFAFLFVLVVPVKVASCVVSVAIAVGLMLLDLLDWIVLWMRTQSDRVIDSPETEAVIR
jgi:hypothetical protein